MVHSARFELTTYCSGGNRSIQLSYECLYLVLYNTFEISQTANSLFLKKNQLSTAKRKKTNLQEAASRQTDCRFFVDLLHFAF